MLILKRVVRQRY